ncbi:hypothetical protein ES703_94277 [subsurface metagenome]
MEDEICENCGGIINIFEQAFVYKGRVVCEKCDKKLRALLEVPTEAAPVRPADSPLMGRAEPPKPEELPEFPELQGSPIRIEQTLDISKPPTPKPLPHKRRRLRIRSTLLWLILAGWSLLCLFLIFYVPVRYEAELKGNVFGVEYLIVSFMALWFLGALVLFIVTTFTQKDEKLKPG